MEEILLVSGLLLAITCLTAMTQFSKHIKLDSDVLVHSKLQCLPHLLDGSGRWLLFIGSTLALPSFFLGFSDILPHKLAAHLIVISSLILLIAALIIIPSTIWRIILFFGFDSLIHIFHSTIKKIIPTANTLRLTFLGLGKICIGTFIVTLKLCCWYFLLAFKHSNDIQKEEDEKNKDAYEFWYGHKDPLHIDIKNKYL